MKKENGKQTTNTRLIKHQKKRANSKKLKRNEEHRKKQELAKRVKAANDELKLLKSANERTRQSQDPGRVRAAHHHHGRHETTLTVVSGETDRAGRRECFQGQGWCS